MHLHRLPISHLWLALEKHSSGITVLIPIFNYSGWGQYVLMMSWFSECSLQLCQPEQWCLLHMSGSGPSCNLRLITAGEAKSRNGTQLLPAALNYFSTTGFPLPRSMFLSLSQLLHCLSLISLFPVLFSPSLSLSISISCIPPTHLILHLFLEVSVLLSLSLSRSLSLSASLPSFCLGTPQGPRRVQWVWSWSRVLLSLLRVLERPIYQ